MSAEIIKHGIVGCATHIGSKNVNEDYCVSVSMKRWKAVILADGVSSAQRGGEAAKLVTDAFLGVLIKAENNKQRMSSKLLKTCYNEASEKLKYAASEIITKGQELQTTLIAIIETYDRFFITYLGDGDIWLRRNDGWAIPLMIPHKKGSLLSGGLTEAGIKGTPVFIEYSNSFASGTMIIAGTDGVFDIEGGIDTLISELEQVLHNNQPDADTNFNLTIDDLLKKLHEKYKFSDNATLGVIVTGKTQVNFDKKE